MCSHSYAVLQYFSKMKTNKLFVRHFTSFSLQIREKMVSIFRSWVKQINIERGRYLTKARIAQNSGLSFRFGERRIKMSH